MHPVTTRGDPYLEGHVMTARLAPQTLGLFDPVLRRLLGGTQLFIKQADGRWAPRGCQLGKACCFDYEELQSPTLRVGVGV